MATANPVPGAEPASQLVPGVAARSPRGRQYPGSLLHGLVLVGGLAAAAYGLGQGAWMRSSGLSALTLAIVLGLVAGNTVYPRLAAASSVGVVFAKQNLLRLGIILYGLRLTFQDVGHVGLAGVVIDATMLASTFALSWFLGTRLFGLERETALLIGAGSSICGAAAVMATEPVVRARAEQVTVAVSTVVVFGTLAMFIYPEIFRLFPMTPTAYGTYAGSTIHEVAQALAAGHAVGDQAANMAVIEKMVRVMMLAPFLALLSAVLSRASHAPAASGQVAPARRPRRIAIPWFAFGFIAMVGLNSLGVFPKAAVAKAIDIDTVLLSMAMAALGLTSHLSVIRGAGARPLLLAALLFAWLIGGGFLINIGISALFA
jgi:uncharacterized integral membrane protein (TIGR00698 family)